MAKTRGGGSYSQRQDDDERVRPTTSVRNRNAQNNPHASGRGKTIPPHADTALQYDDIERDAGDFIVVELAGPSGDPIDTAGPSSSRPSAAADTAGPSSARPSVSASAPATFPYPRGPNDRSVLATYGSHVARQI